MTAPSQYDAAVIGAGPVGAVAAVALARRGARVLLLEAKPQAAARFAGEWIHPTGVEVLRRLDLMPIAEASHHAPGRGFAVFPDDDGEPIRLPYVEGTALTCEHRDLVEHLRARAAAEPGVDYAPHTRVRSIADRRLACEPKDGAPFEVQAAMIVGADGRASLVRQHLGLDDEPTHLSHMAGVELHDVELPFEGYGHVMLGGPGPILMYRISSERVRVCLDVPAGSVRREPSALWDGFAPMLPESLRPAFRRALEDRRLVWAANGFRPRACYGRGPYTLVGDAVGHVHPLTAGGITLGLLDAEALAESDCAEELQRRREPHSYVPELLANALYQVFSRDDAGAVSIRHAVYDRWRQSETDRRRTMRILSGEATGQAHFGRAFVRMAVEALKHTTSARADAGRWRELIGDVVAFPEWAQWPAASLLPHAARARSRPRSKPDRAMPWPFERAGAAEPPPRPAAAAGDADALQWLARACDALDGDAVQLDAGSRARLLEALHDRAARARAVGETDATGPRRRELARSLVEPLASVETPLEQLPEIVAAATAGGPADELPLEALDRAARRLLEAARLDEGDDVVATARLCRALSLLHRSYPGLHAPGVIAARDAALRKLRRRQHDDGRFIDRRGTLEPTADALEAQMAAGVKPVHPSIRRGTRWLLGLQQPAGGFGDGTASARALHALHGAQAGPWEALAAAAAAIARALEPGSDDPRAVTEAVRALARHERRAALRPAPKRARAAAPREQASDADWAFCEQSLLDVSRTFARPIEMLPGDLRAGVTCGYLLCRVADTIEDHPTLPMKPRDELYAGFLAALHGETDGSAFAARFGELVQGESPDFVLCRNLPKVMRVFRGLPARLQKRITPWVEEMARGMSLYGHREAGPDGLWALHTLEDLQRYCYFVAGTVGHLLTGLFLAEVQDEAGEERVRALLEHAEAFGEGLQLVNILKDVTDDRERGTSFVPRTLCRAQGLEVADLLDPDKREAAHAAVRPIFEVARRRLDGALEYTLAIPPSQQGIRLFCLLPLWMAARTLALAEGNDAMFVPGEPVKISRAEVERLIGDCVATCGLDDALRSRYAALWDTSREVPDAPEHRELH